MTTFFVTFVQLNVYIINNCLITYGTYFSRVAEIGHIFYLHCNNSLNHLLCRLCSFILFARLSSADVKGRLYPLLNHTSWENL